MRGALGVANFGAPTAEATYEYEVCYKCHAWNNPVRSPIVDRIFHNNNVADEFSTANASYHPVEAQGKNPDVPSLLQPWNTTSLVYCTDCHSSEAGGVSGPHGSAYRPLLVRQYVTIDNTRESYEAYALCYGCHNRASILRADSFDLHDKHIRGKRTPCSVCHDPHGVSAAQAPASQSTHLINFDRDVVFPSEKANNGAGPFFVDQGARRGSCTLLCHGEDHDDEDYR